MSLDGKIYVPIFLQKRKRSTYHAYFAPFDIKLYKRWNSVLGAAVLKRERFYSGPVCFIAVNQVLRKAGPGASIHIEQCCASRFR